MIIDTFTIAEVIATVFTIVVIVALCLRTKNGCSSGNGTVHSRSPIHKLHSEIIEMNKNSYKCEDIRELIDSGAQLVDVRSPQEYTYGALPGAINLPLEQVATAPETLNPNRPVLLYCISGQRSEQARSALAKIGFENVMNIGGYQHYQHCN